MLRNRVVALGILGALMATAMPAAGQPKEPPELTQILNLMEQRQKKAGLVRVVAEGVCLVPKGAVTEYSGVPLALARDGLQPPQDERTEVRQDVTFDFPNQRWRRQCSEKIGNDFTSWVNCYDGKKFYSAIGDGFTIEQLGPDFRPGKANTKVGGGKADIFNSEWWPYLLSQGFVFSKHRQPFRLSEFALVIDREELYVYGKAVADGVPCLLIRQFPHGPKGKERYCEYAVGRDDGAVRRMTDWREETDPATKQKTVWKSVEILITYRKVGDRLVPASWVNELLYLSNGIHKQCHSYKMKVTAFEAGETLADRFAIIPASGAGIKESQYPEDIQVLREKDKTVVHYQVNEKGEWIEGDVIDGQFKPRPKLFWWWVAGGSLLPVTLGLAGWRVYRRRSPTAPTNPDLGGPT